MSWLRTSVTAQDSSIIKIESVGTNVVLLGEKVLVLDEISSWDTYNYDPQAAVNTWRTFKVSRRLRTGTWTHYQFDLSQVYH